MRIAIPVNEESIDAPVCVSFGRAPYFLLYNSITKETDFLDNNAVAASGGAGIKAAQAVADRGTQILISPRCGENAAEVLTSAEVIIYRSKDGTAKENIDAYFAEQLTVLSEIHPGFHGHEQK